MSTLIVEITEITAISRHPNADNLDIAKVKGWECIVKKDAFKAGDKCIYVPIDAVLPMKLSDNWGVTDYLHNGRVRTVKLRGVFSQGLVIPISLLPSGASTLNGTDIKKTLGITKYEAPMPMRMLGETAPEHPFFYKYTDIENLLNFPNILYEKEAVVISEKIHGTNFRAGCINGDFMVGTKNVRRKESENPDIYWQIGRMFNLPTITKTIMGNVILYGEIYGKGIQKLWYGEPRPTVRFFDVSINGKFLDFFDFTEFCMKYHLPVAPTIAINTPWKESLKEFANKNSTIATHIREGIVIKPMKERYDAHIGRVIFKHINKDYLLKDYGDLH